MTTLAAAPPRRIALVAGLLTCWLIAVVAAAIIYQGYDLKIYHEALWTWLRGGGLYTYTHPNSGLGFTYPPFAGYVLAPVMLWPVPVAATVSAVLNLAVLTAFVWLLAGPLIRQRGWPVLPTMLAATLLAALLEPVRQTIGFGQVNLWLALAVMADIVGLKRGAKWAGIGTGLACAIKLTPGLFIVYFALCRRWRAAATAAAAFATVSVAGWILSPSATTTFLTEVFLRTDKVGRADLSPNQALSGLMARLYDSPDSPTLVWLGFALFTAVWGMSRAVEAHRAGNELAAYTLVGLTTALVSPISWSHHLVWVVPATVILATWALNPPRTILRFRLRDKPTTRWCVTAAVYGLFVASPIWWFDVWAESHWIDGPLRPLTENSFTIAMILLVGFLPLAAPRGDFTHTRPHRPPPPPSTSISG